MLTLNFFFLYIFTSPPQKYLIWQNPNKKINLFVVNMFIFPIVIDLNRLQGTLFQTQN